MTDRTLSENTETAQTTFNIPHLLFVSVSDSHQDMSRFIKTQNTFREFLSDVLIQPEKV